MLLTAAAFGRKVGVTLNPADLDAVAPWLPHWWDLSAPPVEPEKTWAIGPPQLAEFVLGELELWVAEQAVDLVFIHSGVVAIDGKALLLPGTTFAGKSSLTAALVRAGAEYGSDEFAPLDASGLVHAYARPIAVRSREGRRRLAVSELGGRALTKPVPVGGVALLRYAADHIWAVRAISAGEAILGLVENCLPARSRPEQMLQTLAAAVPQGRHLAGTRGDADEAAAALVEWMQEG